DSPYAYFHEPHDNYHQPTETSKLVTDPEDGSRYLSDRVNVMLDSDAKDETFRKFAASFKRSFPSEEYEVVYYDTFTKLLQVKVPTGTVNYMVEEMPRKITDVEFLPFPEGLMELNAKRPNDPVFKFPDLSWYFSPIEAPEAWEVTMGSPDVTVAIVDTYFDLRHDDLNSDRIVKPYSVTHRNGNVAPDGEVNPLLKPEEVPAVRAHGTFVAALAIGNADNGRGSCGIAPRCRFMPVSMGMNLSSMRMLQGVLYAIYQDADVVNISAGTSFPEKTSKIPVSDQVSIAEIAGKPVQRVWDYAFEIADKRNITIVWAAGNDDVLCTLDPSKRSSSTIRVSAVDPSLHKTKFSNFGNLPSHGIYASTVSAPGQQIFAAVPDNSYAVLQGTSFSAPIVAGTVALMKSKRHDISNKEIIETLKATGTPVAGCSTIGPLIKIRKALDKV
ncbi:MAG: S8 family serine peptidase, partial [Muribaculaceae bacterium]|nr:S8 family serine peptidase [Muribaculaceae bacterium]